MTTDANIVSASTQTINGDLVVTGNVYGSTVAIHSGGTSVGLLVILS